jgi:hypothetical protein
VTKTIHLFIHERLGSSIINCTHCDSETAISNEQLWKSERSLRITCKCRNVFTLIINRRSFQRREVSLTGELRIGTSQKQVASIHIVSLSVDGIGFLTQNLELQIGNLLTVAFSLDNVEKTAIIDEIMICNINNNRVGARFLAHTGYNPEIDFYLMDKDDTGNDE